MFWYKEILINTLIILLIVYNLEMSKHLIAITVIIAANVPMNEVPERTLVPICSNVIIQEFQYYVIQQSIKTLLQKFCLWLRTVRTKALTARIIHQSCVIIIDINFIIEIITLAIITVIIITFNIFIQSIKTLLQNFFAFDCGQCGRGLWRQIFLYFDGTKVVVIFIW